MIGSSRGGGIGTNDTANVPRGNLRARTLASESKNLNGPCPRGHRALAVLALS